MGEHHRYRKTSGIEVVGKNENRMMVQNVGKPETRVSNSRMENPFSGHAPKPIQPEVYGQLREKAKELAYLIDEWIPNGREKSLAQTSLEETVFWVNTGISS